MFVTVSVFIFHFVLAAGGMPLSVSASCFAAWMMVSAGMNPGCMMYSCLDLTISDSLIPLVAAPLCSVVLNARTFSIVPPNALRTNYEGTTLLVQPHLPPLHPSLPPIAAAIASTAVATAVAVATAACPPGPSMPSPSSQPEADTIRTLHPPRRPCPPPPTLHRLPTRRLRTKLAEESGIQALLLATTAKEAYPANGGQTQEQEKPQDKAKRGRPFNKRGRHKHKGFYQHRGGGSIGRLCRQLSRLRRRSSRLRRSSSRPRRPESRVPR
jgi:hypothetical protein